MNGACRTSALPYVNSYPNHASTAAVPAKMPRDSRMAAIALCKLKPYGRPISDIAADEAWGGEIDPARAAR
jgi:hypothetical protein